jgi:ribonuclease HII
VILGDDHGIAGLADSKVLKAEKRELLSAQIMQYAKAWFIASASVAEIDQHNILKATMLAMRRAVEGLGTVPHEALIDGNRCPPGLVCPSRAIVKGDATVAEISAASILAKVARDQELLKLDAVYPGYGFAEHKGYGTPAHVDALKRLGPCAVHRSSFEPVKSMLAARQQSLW